eukprot:CAMPEP_0177670510 /NCGR_PEP_ID=MMETSP0447-20121125/24128_1 /TAXON_ID=0 /ORGANISM="Stygamoeba regulata, Strain BSH-02190019" /LENGTH=166 /DNA_ID=CAMNT_0019177679 /DNA_START=70 /DNA_END=570 /DNA_ORIENTATION=-
MKYTLIALLCFVLAALAAEEMDVVMSVQEYVEQHRPELLRSRARRGEPYRDPESVDRSCTELQTMCHTEDNGANGKNGGSCNSNIFVVRRRKTGKDQSSRFYVVNCSNLPVQPTLTFKAQALNWLKIREDCLLPGFEKALWWLDDSVRSNTIPPKIASQELCGNTA